MTVEKRTISDFFKPVKKQKVEQNSTDLKKETLKGIEQDSTKPQSDSKSTEKLTTISSNASQIKGNEGSSGNQNEINEFDKELFIKSLTEDQRELLSLELETMDPSWLRVLHTEIVKPYFLNLKKFLLNEWEGSTPIFPPREDIYSWTRLTPFDQVKVLIIGQDPYHNFNQAHGLAFSVKDPKTRVPPSLVNIYKGIKIDYPKFEIPKNGDLTKWAQQGVLMLNTCLTVKAHLANSHSGKGWEQFTKAVVKKLIEYHSLPDTNGLIVIAWGGPALKMVNSVGKIDWERNLLLKCAHPSPLSARRGFFEAQHFLKCNEWLKNNLGDDSLIDWALIEGNRVL